MKTSLTYANRVDSIVKALLRKQRPTSLDSVKATEQIVNKRDAYLKFLEKHQPTLHALKHADIVLMTNFMINIMHKVVNEKQVTAVPSPAVRKRKKAE